MVRILALSLFLIVSELWATSAFAQDLPSDAYLDPVAAEMVGRARSVQERANARIAAYEMVARQRISLRLRTTRRDRLVFRREIASDVKWSRTEGQQVEVLGAREALPLIRPGVSAFAAEDPPVSAFDLAVDPVENWLIRVPTSESRQREVRFDGAFGRNEGDSEDGFIHPLSVGSEAHYRFRSGETTRIRLGDGRTITLLELQVLPRRARPQLLSGSFWLEADTYSPVRGVFSLASPMRMNLDVGVVDFDIGSADLRYLTIEFGFWEGRWWLPRLVAMEGVANVGSVTVPLIYEQLYDEYRIHSDDEEWPGFEPADTMEFNILRRRCPEDANRCEALTVLVPRDTLRMVQSPELPPSVYAEDDGWIVGGALISEVSDLVSSSRWRGLTARVPRFYWSLIDGGLIHYNRVEGLTLGTTAGVELGPLGARTSVWFGLADHTPGFVADLSRQRIRGSEAIGVYRRLEAFAPGDEPFSLGSSFSAFAFGRDDGDYYRALGAGATIAQDLGRAAELQLRVFGERQTAVEKRTDASIPHWARDHVFRPNPPADEADQAGIELMLSASHGLDPRRFRVAADLSLLAETGTFEFLRPSIGVRSTIPLQANVTAALDVSGGTAFGGLPVQRLWWVGGRGTVRGIRAEERVVGDTFWAARAELARGSPGFRTVIFGDAGWAGERNALTVDPRLVSIGAGVSLLDGLVRFDLSRPVKGGDDWSFQVHLDAPL